MLTAVTGEQTAGGVWQKLGSNKLQDKQALWYYPRVTRLPSIALKRSFPKEQSRSFPPLFHGVNDHPGFWEWQSNSKVPEVFPLGAEAD